MTQITPMVKQLLILNIIVYVGANFIAKDVSYDLLALYFPLNEKFEWWQIITHMFMHAKIEYGIMHILFNMFGLYMFGSNLEHFWGQKKFLIFYLLSGIGAALLLLAINYFQFQSIYGDLINLGATDIEIKQFFQTGSIRQVGLPQSDLQSIFEIYHGSAVGASGALYGILVAFAIMFPHVELMLMFIPVPIKAKYFVPFIVIMDLYAGLNGNSLFGYSTGIAHFAHFGGALTGFLLMLYYKKTQFDKNRWD
jgi:membrane associated rhomboid family serine protease